MKLFEHPDFRDVLVATAEQSGIPEQFVEKDYYVTEALRIVAAAYSQQVVFKGGTSLSKGWGLIERFSEDIDLFLNPQAFVPALSKRGIDREMKRFRDLIGAHPGLTLLPDESRTVKSLGREDYFGYASVFGPPRTIRPALKVEPGVQSGDHPLARVELTSYAGRFVRDHGLPDIADDAGPFTMTLLHYRRTFVEKLFTIHGKVERLLLEGIAVGRDARHYADLHALGRRADVREMLRTREYAEIRHDYDQKSRQFFPKSYRSPDGLGFSHSQALFPPDDLGRRLRRDYESQCRILFYGPYPTFDEVLAGFEELREWL